MLTVPDERARMQEALWQAGRQHAKASMTWWCQMVMEAERDAFLGRGHHERAGRRRGHRNGYRERHLETPYGRLKLEVPRVRGSEEPLRTALWDAYARRTGEVDAAVEA